MARTIALLVSLILVAGCATATTKDTRAPTVALEPDSLPAHPYLSQVYQLIKAKWVYPRAEGERGAEGIVLVEFHIAKDGRLVRTVLRTSAGNALDDAILEALRRAQPFPPVPDDLSTSTLRINGRFVYRVEKR